MNPGGHFLRILLASAALLFAARLSAQEVTPLNTLPDSPGRVSERQDQSASQREGLLPQNTGSALPPCPAAPQPNPPNTPPLSSPCRRVDPYARFLNSSAPIPLSPKQKGYLAIRDVVDPFNLLTITANSAFTIGIDSHTAYGPGLKGFGRNVGYSFAQDATGEFIGTFGVCSLFHEDPHYHRLPNGTTMQRVFHALRRTLIAQSDTGRPMPNYENLITYPASAELSNLYVPGVNGNGPSTVERILIGLATDPAGNLITEFLPDFAKQVHIRIVFVQQILNQIASGEQF